MFINFFIENYWQNLFFKKYYICNDFTCRDTVLFSSPTFNAVLSSVDETHLAYAASG